MLLEIARIEPRDVLVEIAARQRETPQRPKERSSFDTRKL
jgi:hypothetical protein